MIQQQVIARRYAKGLMNALAEKELDIVPGQIASLARLLLPKDSDLKRLFSDPVFSSEERLAVIDRIAVTYAYPEALRNFLALLVKKNRFALLPLIHEALITFIDEHHGQSRAIIKTAKALAPYILDDITRALTKLSHRNILVEVKEDLSLIGGIRVEMGGKVFDGSVRAKLDALKNGLDLQ